MAPSADPETYLRLAHERSLARGGGHGPRADPEVASIGRALVASEALGAEVVGAVREEYGLALALRYGSAPRYGVATEELSPGSPLPAARVALGPFELPGTTGHLTVNKVVMAQTSTRLFVTGTGPPPGQPPGFGPGIRRLSAQRQGANRRPALTVKDDQGNTASAAASSWGGSSHGWEAQLETDKALAPSAEWLEVDGSRLALPAPPPECEVLIEPVPPAGPLEAALTDEIIAALTPHGMNGDLDAFVQAIVAVGARPADDPGLAQARRVHDALSQGHYDKTLPEPWRSVSRRQPKHDGVEGQIAIGAELGPLGGHWARIDALYSHRELFLLDVCISPGASLLFHPSSAGDLPRLQWWAEDDRGNSYLGVASSGRGSWERAEGTVEFACPIDPKASRLRVLVTGPDERAVVHVGLGPLGQLP